MSQQYFAADFAAPRGDAVRAISVRNLFGDTNYDIELTPLYGLRLGILSGANGTGKTTILRLVRAALSAIPGRQKAPVFGIRFDRFEVTLFNGLKVRFERERRSTSGPFSYHLTPPGGEELMLRFNTISSSVRTEFEQESMESEPETPEESATVAAMGSALASRAPHIVYLPTNRDMETRVPSADDHDPLRASIMQFMRRLNIRARRESNDAEVAAYDVLARTTKSALEGQTETRSRDELLALFRDQMERIDTYAGFGLTTRISADALIEQIGSSSESQFKTLSAIIVPYLESQRARLDSQKETYDFINQFMTSLNSFLTPKTVVVNLLEEFRVYKREAVLPLRALSSGERQLLRIFTSSAALAAPANLVLIDEPELSLNGNWTRALIRNLLAEILTQGTQFIFATHSIELLAQYEEAVIDLVP